MHLRIWFGTDFFGIKCKAPTTKGTFDKCVYSKIKISCVLANITNWKKITFERTEGSMWITVCIPDNELLSRTDKEFLKHNNENDGPSETKGKDSIFHF